MQLLRAVLSLIGSLLLRLHDEPVNLTQKKQILIKKKRLCRQREAYKLRYCKVAPFKGEIMTCDVALQQQ